MPIDSAFIFAAYDGDLEKVIELWEEDRTANIDYPLPPIVIEIPHGPGIIINIALEPFGHVSGQTALIAAASQGNRDIVEYLLKQGANTDLFDRKDYSALSYACKEGYIGIVKLLIQYGAAVDYSNLFIDEFESPEFPINIAIGEMHVEIAKLLMHHGVNINAADSMGWKPIFAAIANDDATLLAYLIGQGIDFLGARNIDGENVLMVACCNHSLHIVELLLQIDALDVNELSPMSGFTYLIATILSEDRLIGDTDMLCLLLTHGANVNQADDNDVTPLMHAINAHDYIVIQLLLTHGANVDTTSYYGRTAVFFALEREHSVPTLHILPLLLQSYHANINIQDMDGKSLLMLAINLESLTLVEYLLTQGISVRLQDKLAHTALHYCCHHPCLPILRKLLNHVECEHILNQTDLFGWTPLMHAVNCNLLSTVKVLLGRNANAHITDKLGKTVLDKAHSAAMARILLQHNTSTMTKPLIQNSNKHRSNNNNHPSTTKKRLRALSLPILSTTTQQVVVSTPTITSSSSTAVVVVVGDEGEEESEELVVTAGKKRKRARSLSIDSTESAAVAVVVGTGDGEDGGVLPVTTTTNTAPTPSDAVASTTTSASPKKRRKKRRKAT